MLTTSTQEHSEGLHLPSSLLTTGSRERNSPACKCWYWPLQCVLHKLSKTNNCEAQHKNVKHNNPHALFKCIFNVYSSKITQWFDVLTDGVARYASQRFMHHQCLQCTTLLMLWIILTQAAWVSVVICIYLVVVLRFLGSLGCQGYAEIVMKSWQECACVLTHSPQSHAPHKLVALTTWFNDEILPYNYLWKTDTSIGECSKQ